MRQLLRPVQAIALSAMLVLTLASCTRNEEQAIRHLVVAELIQREHLTESHIEIRNVEFGSEKRATVTANLYEEAGRSGTWRTVQCAVERDGERWIVREVRQQ